MADIGDSNTNKVLIDKRREVEKMGLEYRVKQMELKLIELDDQKAKIKIEIEGLKESLSNLGGK
jgi:chaperonin cofactor prefoldin